MATARVATTIHENALCWGIVVATLAVAMPQGKGNCYLTPLCSSHRMKKTNTHHCHTTYKKLYLIHVK